MKIAMFGATGPVGRAVVKEALRRGHELTVLTRDAAKVDILSPRLHVVEGSVTDAATVKGLIEGHDAVIQTLGIGGKGNGQPTTIVSEANNVIMSAMRQSGVRRLVAVSVAGAGDSLAFLPWAFRTLVLPLFMKWFQAIIDDKNRMEAAISQSDLDWTVVRCTTVKPRRATGHVNATLNGKGLKFSISAADMAEFMVDQLNDDKFLRKCPTISN